MLKSAVGTELPKTLMVVDIGFERVEMSVFEDRALQFVRSVSIGSNDITLALKEPMVTDKGEVRFSDKEAEDVKRSLGIAYDAVTLSEGLESVQALSLMRPVLENILKEIRRSIDYYIHEYGSDESISIYLTGSGSKLKNLDRYFREELNLPVDRLDPAHFISASESVLPKDDFVSIAAATGVAILGKNSMNFLPIEYKTAKVEFAEKAMLRMMVIVMVAVFGSLFLITKARIKDYEGRLKNVPAQIEFFGNIKELQEKVVAREEFLLKVKNSSLDIERIMREFSNVIPPGVVISSLSITSNGKSMNIIGVLYGHGKSSEGVLTKFMEDIEKSKCFKEAQLSFVQNQGGRADGSSSFQMECLLE
jgi:Tfp pilus assembly protein PilN